jgi:protein-disulfide isomerase
MPKKVQSYRRQRSLSARNFRRNILIIVACVVGVVLLVAFLANRNSAMDVSFPAREMGPADAKVVVEEFSDYQCPWCGYFAMTVEGKLREQYITPEKIRFIFRNYPIVDSYVSGGQESHLAALAALCAGDQDKFWNYHDALYANQSETENSGNLSRSRLYSLAVQLQLDGIAFEKCMNDQSHANVINADQTLAVSYYKIQGTPSFIVNGHLVEISSGEFKELFDAIDLALKATAGT